MFNRNPRTATVLEYSGPDGVRRPAAELMRPRSLGYQQARLAIDVEIDRMYLAEVCYRAAHGTSAEYTFYIDEYDVETDTRNPARSHTAKCNGHGLASP
jgi:hypothetical protein